MNYGLLLPVQVTGLSAFASLVLWLELNE